MKVNRWLTTLFILCVLEMHGQQSQPDAPEYLKQTQQKSGMPQASEQKRVIESKAEVDYSGQLNIAIPLLTVPGRGEMKFPLEARYRSGIHSYQEPTWIGLGWSLNVGSIVRKVIFKPDYFRTSQSWAPDVPDAFAITTPEGTYTIYNFGTMASPNFQLEIFKDWKIDCSVRQTGSGYDIDWFVVTTENGTRYVYNKALPGFRQYFYYVGNTVATEYYEYPGNNEWVLTAVLGPDYVDGNGDRLSPLDSPNPSIDNKGNWMAITYNPSNHLRYQNPLKAGSSDPNMLRYTPSVTVSYPYRIITPTHVAEFTLADEDPSLVSDNEIKWDTGELSEAGDTKNEKKQRISSIKLYRYSGNGLGDHDDNSITTVDFIYATKGQGLARSRFGDTKTTLKKIVISSMNSIQQLPPYEFEYNTLNPKSDPWPDGTNKRWSDFYFGHYNSYPGWQNSPPNDDAAPGDAAAWNLKRITYPQGSVVTFEYTDAYCIPYLPYRHNHPCLGSREGFAPILSQTIEDGMGNTSLYTYRYGSDINSHGDLYLSPIRYFTDWNVRNGYVEFFWDACEKYLVFDKIEETQPDQSKIARYYTSTRDCNFAYPTAQGSSGRSDQEIYQNTLYLRGLLKKVEYLNSSGKIMKKEEHTYAESIVKTLKPTGGDPVYFCVRRDSESVTTKTYDQNGQNEVVSTILTEYNSTNGLPNKITETNSDGTKRITRKKYVSEYYTMYEHNLFMLDAKHMHNVVIEQTTNERKPGDVERVVSATLTLFKVQPNSIEIYPWDGVRIYPWQQLALVASDKVSIFDFIESNTQRLTGTLAYDSRYQIKETFDSYDDYGNPLQSTNANAISATTKWSYNSSKPIAQILNAKNSETSVSNFDDGNMASWVPLDQAISGNTRWSVENGQLKLVYNMPSIYGEFDRVTYTHPAEIKGTTVLEFDVRISDSNSWDLLIGMGGDQWGGQEWSGYEMGVWTAINNETWYHCTNTWYSIKSGLNIGQWYHFKIVVNPTAGKVDYYVDGQRFITDASVRQSTTGIQKVVFGRYGYSSIASTWYIDNVRLYPDSAVAVSASYDPITLNVNQIQDKNGNIKFFNYDGFGRLTKEFARIDGSQKLVREHRYQYSRTVGDAFGSLRPNSVETIRYESSNGFSDFSTSNGWGYYGDVTFNVQNAGETTVRMGTQYGDWNYIYKSAGTGHRIARVDFYPDNTTGSLPHVIAFDDGSWRFCVIYNATGGWWAEAAPNTFVVQDARDDWDVVTYTPIGSFSAPRNRWYTVEIEKTDGGEMYAFVYPKGEGRIYTTGYMHQTTGFPSNWSANVLSWSITDYYYLANHYVGLPDHGETFSDGLGRTLQEQHQLNTTSIVSANTTYDLVGRPQKRYKAYDWDFGGASRHRYDPNYQDNASAKYPSTAGYPFAEIQYLNDPLDRPHKLGDPGPTFRIGSGNEVQLQYWSNADGDVGGYAANTLFKSRKIDEDGKITDTFTDKLGRVVGSTVDPDNLKLKTTFTYDVMGNMTSSTAPNNLSTTYLYNSLQQLRTKTSPDAGTVQYLYDRNGNLRLAKDANHGGSSANNFYQSSTIFCPYSTSGQFTIALPGKVTISTAVYEIDEWETVLVQIKQSGVVLCYTTSNFWNGSSNSVYLPAGTYDYVVTTAGWYGAFQYTINATTGLEFAYNKYDALNRIIETGEYESSSGGSFTQANADNVNFPTAGRIIDKTFLYDVPSGDPLATTQRNLVGRVSMARSYNKGAWVSSTIYSYNDLGSVEWILQRHSSGRTWRIGYEYDLQGRTTKKSFADTYNGYGLYTFYEYDQVGRLARVYTDADVNGVSKVKEAEYTYTATSKPSRLILGNGAQDVSYAYNERDFVRQISASRFYENLYYHGGHVAIPSYLAGYAQKNGNVAAIEWNTNQSGLLGYGFTYDNANRLEAAQTYSNTGISDKWMISSIRYDAAGNILSMNRYDKKGEPIDILTYNYESGKNRLSYINDDVRSDYYTTDIDDQSVGNYIYDPNGNVLRDIGSSINSISYGVRNLPVSLIKNGITYNYSYDASDARIHSNGSSKYYVNGANGQTEAVVDAANPGVITHNIWGNDLVGQVKRNGSLARYYHLKDHLGSIRVTVDASGNRVASDDYDPWGMLTDGRSYNAGQADARYKFTGKEKDTETGLDYFGARCYDSRIGRWMAVDPLAEKYPSFSPYNYGANNPTKYIDPDGCVLEEAQFDSKGKFLRIFDDGKKEKTGSVLNPDGSVNFKFWFNDRMDFSLLGSRYKQLDMNFMSRISGYLHEGGVDNSKGLIGRYVYALIESHGRMDFMKYILRDSRGSENMLYLAGNTAYNLMDAGNFVWGVANYELGNNLDIALLGAHANNAINGRRDNPQLNIPWWSVFDQTEDQNAITAGYLGANSWWFKLQAAKK